MRFEYKHVLLVGLLCWASAVAASTFPHFGVDSISSDFFKTRYQYGELVNYLDNISDFVVYQAETTGEWAKPDQLVFSVQGNSYRWNRYYWDGFRIDSRFMAGSSVYRPNLEYNSFTLDTYQSRLDFASDAVQPSYVSLQYNVGNLGGISPGTKEMINWFHASASERLLYPTAGQDPRVYRSHAAGAGVAEGQFLVKGKAGKVYRQHIYGDVGQRQIAAFDNNGLTGLYPDWYYKVQMDGELPMSQDTTGTLPTLHYLWNVSSRQAMGQEFYYNTNEVMANETYSFSLYAKNGKRSISPTTWTAGLTWTTNTQKHTDLCFSRNLADQDGEAFEPFAPDGNTHELNASVTLRHQILPWLSLHYEGFNSLVHFAPTETAFHNDIYLQLINQESPTAVYRYDWTSEAFTSGVLENTLGVEAECKVTDWFELLGKLDFTLDGVLLGDGKSFVRPNWQAQLSMHFKPTKWFDASVTVGNYRIAFNYETARFFSNDYLNGVIYTADGQQLGTTGGKYHTLKGIQQPAYALVDIPVRFTFGRHEITFLQTYRKYYNLWTVNYAAPPAEYGYYEECMIEGERMPVYYLNPGTQHYVVDYMQSNATGDNFFTSSPYYISQLTKYTYNGKRVTVSLGWQSMQMTSVGALGNGPIHNDVGMLSETTANPNTYLVTTNSGAEYARVGRGDQDKAYVCRFLVAYQIARDWQAGLTFKFKDGQPFTNFDVQPSSDGSQMAIIPNSTKGINPMDGNFGKRDDAFFNLDIHATYTARFKNDMNLTIKLHGYNLWDFGTELTEYTFDQGYTGRNAMSLCIPRGLMANIKLTL